MAASGLVQNFESNATLVKVGDEAREISFSLCRGRGPSAKKSVRETRALLSQIFVSLRQAGIRYVRHDKQARALRLSHGFAASRATERRGEMLGIDIMHDAEALMASHGDLAIEEAVKRARFHEGKGEKAQAARWRRVEAALREMQSPQREDVA